MRYFTIEQQLNACIKHAKRNKLTVEGCEIEKTVARLFVNDGYGVYYLTIFSLFPVDRLHLVTTKQAA